MPVDSLLDVKLFFGRLVFVRGDFFEDLELAFFLALVVGKV